MIWTKLKLAAATQLMAGALILSGATRGVHDCYNPEGAAGGRTCEIDTCEPQAVGNPEDPHYWEAKMWGYRCNGSIGQGFAWEQEEPFEKITFDAEEVDGLCPDFVEPWCEQWAEGNGGA